MTAPGLLSLIFRPMLRRQLCYLLKLVYGQLSSYGKQVPIQSVSEKDKTAFSNSQFVFLSPPVQIARWAHMHRFPSVCPSVGDKNQTR